MNPRPDEADLQAERIKANLCPLCGKPMKDKGSYVRCTSCRFAVTDGVWADREGYCIQGADWQPEDRS